MKKLGLAALVTLPLVGGCYAEAYGPPAYYPHHSYVRVYGPPRVYVAPRPVVVTPPRVRVYW
jgi:hypothetical protein